MSIKKEAVHGIKWTSLSKIITIVIQILQVSILARYLSAEDFGLMSITMVIIGFSNLFADLGISNAIIHKQETTDVQLSSLYWLNIFSGIVLFLIVTILSPFIADFYSEPKLKELIIVLATTFVIIAIGNQYRILFQKEMKFNHIAKIEILSAIGSFIVAVTSAIYGLGVYALVFGSLANKIISTGIYLVSGLKLHKPSFIFKYHKIKDYINFGVYQMAGNAINYFNMQLDAILIGKLLGMEALGIYSIVKQLIMRPAMVINPIINNVAFPILAKVQNDKVRLRNIYLKIVRSVASINFPIYIAMIILAEPIVIIMFGEKWREGIPILQILSIYAMVRAYGNPIGSLLMAIGRVDLNFYINASILFLTPVVIFIGSKFGIIGVAWSISLLQLCLSIPGWYFLQYRTCEISFLDYYKQVITPFVLSIIAGVPAYLMMQFSSNYILEIVEVGIIGLLTYSIFTIFFNKDFIELIKAFR